MITIFSLLLTVKAFSFSGEHFTITAPSQHTEQPKMFGSDVMFLRNGTPEQGTTFLKFIRNASEINDYEQFLKDRVLSSKSMIPQNISSVQSMNVKDHTLYYLTFTVQGKDEEVLASILKKNSKEYLFGMLKNSRASFPLVKKEILESMKTVNFIF